MPNNSPLKREQQNLEWKESWRGDYLRWICGFANAEGGVLIIGRKDRINTAYRFILQGDIRCD